MKINRPKAAFTLNLTLALLVSLAGLPAGAAVFEDFESYVVGSNLHGQGGWSGWAGNPAAGAVVSTDFSFSPTRAVNVNGATDLVHTFSGVTNGQWVFKVMQYIPAISSGTNYVILLNRYGPPFTVTELNWSVQIQNNMDTGQIISDLGAGASRPMVKNQWVEIRVEVNLASNTVAEFYNGQLLSTHVWQDGSGLSELQALDFFAGDSGPVYYDNVSLTPAATPGTSLQLSFSVPSSFNEFNRQAVLEWNGEPGKTYLVQSTDDLTPGTEWKTEEPVTATTVGPVRWMAPESIRDRKFYRLVLPRPEIFSVEPAFIDSSDPTALLYIFGQCLPTNGSIVINGQNYTPTLVDSNGGWAAISLNGLPSGTPVIGSILVLDNASNIVATLPLQSPVLYGTEMTVEQLQGPPDNPPASPEWTWTKGGGASVGRSEGWTKGGGASVGRSTSWTKGGGASVGKPNPGRLAALGRKGGGASVGKPNPGKFFASDDDDDDDGDGLDPDFSLLMPALMKAKEKANRSAARPGTGTGPNGQGLRISGGMGEVMLDEVDLAIPGRGLDFIWTRTYRSRTGPNTAQGAGWDFSYNVSLAPQPDGTIVLHPGNGRADTFYPNGTNGWARDEYFCEVRDLNSDGMPDVLFADTGRWLFNPLGTAAGGKLWQIIDRNSNTMTFEYDLKGQLTTIVDDLGRTNTVAYNLSGQIVSITDSDGRILRYEYDGNGDLTACISPPVIGTPNGNDFLGGKTNRYTYTSGQLDDRLNHNLVSCTDGKGQTWVTIVYQATNNPASLDFDAAASILRGIDRQDIWRGMVIAKPGYVTRLLQAIINDGAGNVTECFYDSRFRPVEVREFTGRANPDLPTTTTQNRPTGKLRDTDQDYFETRFAWNPDSLCTRVMYPRGNSEEMVYQRAFNQNDSRSNRRRAADLRIARELACCDQDDDGDGILDTLTSTFEYDPRFGSPPLARTRLNELEARLKAYGILARTSGGNGGINETLPDTTLHLSAEASASGKYAQVRGFKVEFAVSTTDPRGGVTTSQYDTNGNCTKSIKQGHYAVSNFHIEVDGAYNSYGQLTAITNAPDGNGYRRVDTFSYATNGPQTGYLEKVVVDVGGVVKSFPLQRDARGNVTQSIDPLGFVTTFTYNALDQLVHAESPPDVVYPVITWDVDLRYDANDNLVRYDEGNRDSNGVLNPTNATITTLYEYDVFDRVTRVMDETNPGSYRTNEFVYDVNDNLALYRSGEAVSGSDPNAVVQFIYDERDLPFRSVAAPGTGLGATNQWDYDGNANLRINKIEALVIKQKAYDGFDRCIEVRDALGNAASFAYDRNSNLTFERFDGETNDVAGSTGNRRLSEMRYEYDEFNRLVRWRPAFFDVFTELAIGDGESTSSSTYAPNGQCLTSTDDNGHTTRYAYDTVSRLSSITDPKTNVVSFTYDLCDNVLSVIQTDRSDLTPGAQQFFVIRAFNKLHRLTRSVDNVGNTNLYVYDSRDNLVRETDPRGNDTSHDYDGLGRRVSTRCYDGPSTAGITISTSHVEYDDNSRCVAETDSNSNTTHYAYDSLDRLVTTTNADGTSCSLIWSPRSNLVREQDANGTVISNRFDLLDRCVRSDITPGSGVAATTTFETFAYDGFSRLVAATNDASVCTFAYDSLGNCVRGVSGGLGAMTTTYDGVGNRLSMTYPSGRLVTYTYDALDQVASVGSGSGGLPPTTLATFEYEGPGRVGRVNRANNVNTRLQWSGLVNPANAAGDFGWGQVRGINHQIAGGGAVIDRRVFTYDQKQNKTLRAQIAPFFTGGDMTTNVFEYDALDRMRTIVTANPSTLTFQAYTLDGNGNRQLVVSNGAAQVYSMDATIPPGDFQMDQYTVTPFGTQTYDKNGNLLSRVGPGGSAFYEYDYANRMVEAATFDVGGMPVSAVSFTYDAVGRRIGKIANPGTPAQTVWQYAVYEGTEALEEHENGALKFFAVWPHMHQTGTHMRISAAGAILYAHADDLGNVLALTDASGAVVERYEYDAYGTPQFLTSDGFPMATNASPAGNPFLFHGMEWEPELGWYHVHVRDYNWRSSGGQFLDPQTGRAVRGKVKSVRDTGSGFTGNNPWSGGGGGPKARDHNSSRSNKSGVDSDGRIVRKMIPVTAPDITGAQRSGGGSRVQDHNSSRSNKSSSIAQPGGGGGAGGWSVMFNPREYTISKLKAEGGRHTPFHNKYRPQSRIFTTVSNVLKTKHDTAKNSIGNIR